MNCYPVPDVYKVNDSASQLKKLLNIKKKCDIVQSIRSDLFHQLDVRLTTTLIQTVIQIEQYIQTHTCCKYSAIPVRVHTSVDIISHKVQSCSIPRRRCTSRYYKDQNRNIQEITSPVLQRSLTAHTSFNYKAFVLVKANVGNSSDLSYL